MTWMFRLEKLSKDSLRCSTPSGFGKTSSLAATGIGHCEGPAHRMQISIRPEQGVNELRVEIQQTNRTVYPISFKTNAWDTLMQ